MTPLAIAADSDAMAPPRRLWAVTSVLAAMTLVVLDAAIVNVALPSIGQALAVAPAKAVRVVTAYQLGLVVMLLPAAALGESHGFRPVFVAGAGLFTGASVLCAIAPSLPWLVAARFVQGLGGAAIMALGVALLRFTVPRDRLGAAIGWNALTVALSSAAGPPLGAAILSAASWPWLFAINVPIGACVLVAARALPNVQGTGRALDRTSFILNALTVGLLVIGMESMSSRPPLAIALVASGLIFATKFLRHESHARAPLLPLDLLERVSFRVSVSASVLCFAGQAMSLVALPFYLQSTLGLPPLVVGLYLLPWPLAVACAGPVVGKLADRLPAPRLCLAGGVLLAVGLTSAALLAPHAQPLRIAPFMVLCGLGFGLFNVPNNRNMFLSAPRERSGAAGGMQGLARLTGQTSGAVVMTLLFELSPLRVAPRIGLVVGAALTLAAGATSIVHTRHRSVRSSHS